jgi:hypothetical protein
LAVALRIHLLSPIDYFGCADQRLCDVAAIQGLPVINPELHPKRRMRKSGGRSPDERHSPQSESDGLSLRVKDTIKQEGEEVTTWK